MLASVARHTFRISSSSKLSGSVAHRRFSIMSSRRSSLVAVAQLTVTANADENLQVVQKFTKEASLKGAKMIFFPEACDYLAESKSQALAMAHSMDGNIVKEYSSIAKKNNIWMSMGGIHIKDTEANKTINTHLLLDDTGKVVTHYAKTHLFDVFIPDKNVDLRESAYVKEGTCLVPPIETPIGKLGLAICYDLRFPELSILQKLAGAEILSFPSAFTVPTGQAHWHVLLRARAIENQCYVIAAAQTGKHNEKRASYGHSLIVGPWGDILAEIEEEVGVAYAEIDLDALLKIRQNLPVSTHRRTDLYHLTTSKFSEELGLAQISSYPSDYCTYKFGPVELPGSVIFLKTLQSQAFVNKKPIVPHHVLVTPERPAELLKCLSLNEICDLAQTVQYTYRILKNIHPKCNIQIGLQDGEYSGQTIKHTHFHLLPTRNDSSGIKPNHESDGTTKWRTIEEMVSECSELRSNTQFLRKFMKDPYLEAPKKLELCRTMDKVNLKTNQGWQPYLSSGTTVAIAASEPVLDGHTMLKLEIDSSAQFCSLTPRVVCDLFQMIQLVEKKLQDIFQTESTTVYASVPDGMNAKDIIFHVLPRQKNDFENSDDIYAILEKFTKKLDTLLPSEVPSWTKQFNNND